MASIDELTKLFAALGAHDLERAVAVADDISRREEARGHRGAARLLKGALAASRTLARGNGAATDRSDTAAFIVSDALSAVHAPRGLDTIVLRSAARATLQEVVDEWKHRHDLEKHGLRRRSRLFFHGPPGSGKSLTAAALGRELLLPVYVVRFDAIVGAYLGQTAINLRRIFRFAETNACILLLDEIDAVAKKRGNPHDIGELDRVVITLMQELEHTVPAGFVAATSNLPSHLDEALERRFDLILEFPKPRRAELISYAQAEASKLNLQFTATLKGRAERLASYADVAAFVEGEARRDLLRGLKGN